MRDLTYDADFHSDFARASHNWEWALTNDDRTARKLLSTLEPSANETTTEGQEDPAE